MGTKAMSVQCFFGGVICVVGWVCFSLFFVASGVLFVWKAGSAKANVKKCVGNFACITDGLHAKCPK